jgi:hypothetical protein
MDDSMLRSGARTLLLAVWISRRTWFFNCVSADSTPLDSPCAKLWQKEKQMLETIAVILIILWLLGFVTSYTMGGLIHILLVIAVVVILVRVIQGRRL